MKYTKDEVKAMDAYHKMILNDMLWNVNVMLDRELERDKELERKIDKILEIVPSKVIEKDK